VVVRHRIERKKERPSLKERSPEKSLLTTEFAEEARKTRG